MTPEEKKFLKLVRKKGDYSGWVLMIDIARGMRFPEEGYGTGKSLLAHKFDPKFMRIFNALKERTLGDRYATDSERPEWSEWRLRLSDKGLSAVDELEVGSLKKILKDPVISKVIGGLAVAAILGVITLIRSCA